MPNKQRHRGKNPKDNELFSEKNIPVLRKAVYELSWLLSRGYSIKSSLKLVGDRHDLVSRQRIAVERCACSDKALDERSKKLLEPEDLESGLEIMVDGYNLLITAESALSGGIILQGRDCALRDIASVHGTYKCVDETVPALRIISEFLASLNPAKVIFMLDAPVSNSGRLKELIYSEKSIKTNNWEVILDNNPDRLLCEASSPVVSSDSFILDNCRNWINLAPAILKKAIPSAEIIKLD